jgi:hypothetical protein
MILYKYFDVDKTDANNEKQNWSPFPSCLVLKRTFRQIKYDACHQQFRLDRNTISQLHTTDFNIIYPTEIPLARYIHIVSASWHLLETCWYSVKALNILYHLDPSMISCITIMITFSWMLYLIKNYHRSRKLNNQYITNCSPLSHFNSWKRKQPVR